MNEQYVNLASEYYKKKTDEQIEEIEKMDAQVNYESLMIPALLNKTKDKLPSITPPFSRGASVNKPLVLDDLSRQLSLNE